MKNLISSAGIMLSILLTGGCSNSLDTDEVKDPSFITTPVSAEEAESRLSKVPDFLKNSDLFNTDIVEPTQLFDNVYYVGYAGVGSFVIKTTEGYILIDTMWRPQDAGNVIAPGMKQLGLNPEDIKYVIITHGHSDHYGSARYLEYYYGAKIFMSKIDREYMADTTSSVLIDPFGNYSNEIPQPLAYTEVTDGQKITLGETTITVLSTPGHTAGCISLIVPVTDNGVQHMAAIWGGTGLPATLEENESYLASLNYFESVANAENVDAEMSIHPFINNLLEKMTTLRTRESDDPNPIVIGNDKFKEYIDLSLRKGVVDKIASF